jgi:hypothetical protein
VLSFRPFPKYDNDGKIKNTPPTVPLPCPAGATVLETGVTRNEGTDLYIAGSGVQLIVADQFDNLDQAAIVPVCSPQAASDVQNLVVGDAADGSAAVWTVLRNGDLTVSRRKAGQQAWGNALRLRAGVQQIAAVHGDGHVTTSILIVYTDGKAAFLWQDAVANVWQETPLLVANPERSCKATCYGTSLRVLGEGSAPKPGIKVRVSASVLANVVLNRNSVFLSPDLSFETETDVNGAVSLFDRVRSLTPAIYRFTVAGIKESIDVNPAGGVHKRFNEITAEELRGATVKAPNGSSSALLPENFRSGAEKNQLDAMASSLNQAAGLAKSANGVAGGVRAVAATAAFSSTLKLDAVPDNYRWGVQADSKGVRPASSSVMDSMVSAAKSVGDFFVNLGESIADFFEGVWSRIKDGWTFVVEKTKQGFAFICKLGDIVKSWVLKTLEEIGGFFTWLWEQVKTALEKLWEWLKFIFDWQDILRVRNAMVDMTDQSLQHFERSVGGMKQTLMTGFDDLTKELKGWAKSAGGSPAPGPVSNFLRDVGSVIAPVAAVLDEIMGNSVVAWVMSKLQSLVELIIKIEMPEVSAAVKAAMAAFQNLFSSLFSALTGTLDQLTVVVERIVGGVADITSFSFEKIQQIFISAGAGIIDNLLRVVRDLIAGSMDMVKAMIGVGRGLLAAKMSFPFIEELVKTITLGAVTVDTSFRMGDGLLLLCAIPATIAYKLIFGSAPFKGGEQFVLPFGRVTVQSGAEELRMTLIIGPLVALFIKMVIAITNVADSQLYAPTWHTVSPVTAAFTMLGFAAEIASMHFDGDATTIGLETTMAYMSGLMACRTVWGAYVGRQPGGDIRGASEFIGATGAVTSISHLAFRSALFHMARQKGQEKHAELSSISGLFEDIGSYYLYLARLAQEGRRIALAGGMVARAASAGLTGASVGLVLR